MTPIPESSPPNCLFAYGTLMVAEIWSTVTGCRAKGYHATLRGHSRFRVINADYPGIIATGDLNDCVVGCIYRDLNEKTFRRLDRYEDDFYQRIKVSAIGADNETIVCETYLVPADQRQVLSDKDWSLDWFREHAQADYLRRLGM